MTYLARLREQSGVRIAGGDRGRATPPAALAADPRAIAGDVDGLEQVDVVEVAPPAADTTMPRVPPAAADGAMAGDGATSKAAAAEMAATTPVLPPVPTPRGGVVDGPRTGRRESSVRPDVTAPLQAEVVEAAVSLDAPVVDARTALRQVFRWIAAGPAPDARAGEQAGETPPSRETAGVGFAAIDAGDEETASPAAMSDGARVAGARIGGDRGAVAVRVADGTRAGLEAADVRTVRRGAADEPARTPVERAVEETLTVSIGAIHVRIDAPPSVAPAAASSSARAATPAIRAPRDARRQASRLARHYLRP